MATLWVLNLDAEFELERPRGYQPSSVHERAAKGGRREALRLLGPGDQVVTLQSIRSGSHAGCKVRAWCVTPSVRRACELGGASLVEACEFELLREVNDRAFCASLEQTLPGARFFAAGPESFEQVCAHLATSTRNWLLKRSFGVAGRGQRRIRGGSVSPADQSWIKASLVRGGLQVEPFVEVLSEYSLHGELSASGEVQFGCPCRMKFDARKNFVSAHVVGGAELGTEESAALESAGVRVADALRNRGYFGPFGIDAFRWQDEQGTPHFRGLSEINARYTLGWAEGMGGGPVRD